MISKLIPICFLINFFLSLRVNGLIRKLPKLTKISFSDKQFLNNIIISSTSIDNVPLNSESSLNQNNPIEQNKNKAFNMQPDGTSYIMCGACKTAYVVKENMFAKGGLRVVCSVCGKEWFQNNDRVQKTDNENQLTGMTTEKIGEVKRILADRNFPKYPRVDKVGVFIGNLPYTFEEKDIYDILAEYGVMQVSLVKDPQGQSKGFAFAEV